MQSFRKRLLLQHSVEEGITQVLKGIVQCFGNYANVSVRVRWMWKAAVSRASPQLCSFLFPSFTYLEFFTTCAKPKRALSYGMIENYFCTLGRWLTAFFSPRPTNNGEFSWLGLPDTSRARYHQHISCATRGGNTLHHVYTPFQNGYEALPGPPVGKSDHVSFLLLPS